MQNNYGNKHPIYACRATVRGKIMISGKSGHLRKHETFKGDFT